MMVAAPSTAGAYQAPSRLVPIAPAAISRPAPPPTVDHPPVALVGAFDNGPRTGNRVALTFDADMTPGMLRQLRAGSVASWYNRDVRETLGREGIRATIFLTGLWAETYPGEALEMASDPRLEIGNHTYDHAAFRVPCSGLTAATDRGAEIARAQETIAAITHVTPRVMRFPGDCYDASDVALARGTGLSVISGDIRAGDGFNYSAASVASTVLSRLEPGSIVIMHLQGGPNAPMTGPALRMIIAGARSRGLEFATVSEVLGGQAGTDPRPSLAAVPDPRLALAARAREPLRLEDRLLILARWRQTGDLRLATAARSGRAIAPRA